MSVKKTVVYVQMEHVIMMLEVIIASAILGSLLMEKPVNVCGYFFFLISFILTLLFISIFSVFYIAKFPVNHLLLDTESIEMVRNIGSEMVLLNQSKNKVINETAKGEKESAIFLKCLKLQEKSKLLEPTPTKDLAIIEITRHCSRLLRGISTKPREST